MIYHIILFLVAAYFLFRILLYLHEKTAFAHRYHKHVCFYTDMILVWDVVLFTPLSSVFGVIWFFLFDEWHPFYVFILKQCAIVVIGYVMSMSLLEMTDKQDHPLTAEYVKKHGHFPNEPLD